jgi:stage V sporulation protein R
VLKDAWANYRDESFIQQFLSPNVMRQFAMFALNDNAADPFFTVAGIHDERGYHAVRDALARTRDVSIAEPDIQIVDVSLLGDRVLHLQHRRRNGIPLDAAASQATLAHLRELWGYDLAMEEVPGEG